MFRVGPRVERRTLPTPLGQEYPARDQSHPSTLQTLGTRLHAARATALPPLPLPPACTPLHTLAHPCCGSHLPLQRSPLPSRRDVAAYGFPGLTRGWWRLGKNGGEAVEPHRAGLSFICLSGPGWLLQAKAGCRGGCPGPGVNKDPRAWGPSVAGPWKHLLPTETHRAWLPGLAVCPLLWLCSLSLLFHLPAPPAPGSALSASLFLSQNLPPAPYFSLSFPPVFIQPHSCHSPRRLLSLCLYPPFLLLLCYFSLIHILSSLSLMHIQWLLENPPR